VPFCPSQIPLGLAWDLTPGLRGDRLWTDRAPIAVATRYNVINVGLGLRRMKIA